MVADRHIFVVGQQRVVGAEQLADVLRVLDADVEVGVVANPRRQVQFALAGRVQRGLQRSLVRAVFRQQFQQALAQGDTGAATQGEEGVERAAASGFDSRAGFAVEQAGSQYGVQIENGITDGDTATALPTGAAEDPQRQVLQREVAMPVGVLDPTAGNGGLIHAYLRFGVKVLGSVAQQLS